MESGSGPQSPREPFGPGSPGYGPGNPPGPDKGPQSPAGDTPPQGPQAPQPPDPDSPAPGSPAPESPAPEAPLPGPQAPQPAEGQLWAPPTGASAPPPDPQAPPPGSPQSPAYGGPVPPGGWQQPVAQPQFRADPGELAGWGVRFGAAIIDGLIVSIPVVVLVLVIVGLFAASTTAGVLGILVLGIAMLVFAFGYATFLMARDGEHNGQTWGKQMLGIRAIRDNGQAWDFGSAALREIVLKGLAVGIASSIIPLIPFLLNYLWPLWDDSDRALHDMAVKSHVVRA